MKALKMPQSVSLSRSITRSVIVISLVLVAPVIEARHGRLLQTETSSSTSTRSLKQAPDCSDPQEAISYLGSLIQTLKSLPNTPPLTGTTLLDAVMEAVFPTGTSVDCINSALQGWVVAYLQQNVDSNVQAQLAATLTSVAPFIAQAQSLPWGDGTKTHAISNASSLLLASEAVMASVSASTPAAAYAYMLPFWSLRLAILQVTLITNCTLFSTSCSPGHIQNLNLPYLQARIQIAITQFSQAVTQAQVARTGAVNANFGSKDCGSSSHGASYCSWNLLDGWYTKPAVYPQSNVFSPDAYTYWTPAQYPTEYTAAVREYISIQLTALNSSAAYLAAFDPTSQYIVSTSVANQWSSWVGQWTVWNQGLLEGVTAQLGNANAWVYSPPVAGQPQPKYALQSITISQYTTAFNPQSWMTVVNAVSFVWSTPSGPQISTIGTPLAPSWDVTNITMNMGPNEYVQSVQGWTAGLDGGILSLTFTTNLGNVIHGGNQIGNVQAGMYSPTPGPGSACPVWTPIYVDFSLQPPGTEVWMCGAFGFNQNNPTLSATPSGMQLLDYYQSCGNFWDVCFSLIKWPSLNTIGFYWCYDQNTVTKVAGGK